MRLVIRIFVLSVIVAGGAAAATTSKTPTMVLPSHQSATASVPVPACGPHMPGGCMVNPSSGN